MRVVGFSNVAGVALLFIFQLASALDLPDAGRMTQELNPSAALPKNPPALDIEAQPSPTYNTNDASTVVVNQLHINGISRFGEAELIMLTGFEPGSAYSLADLHQMANKIQGYYRRNGYFLARAYLPAQDNADQSVTIAVIEAQYGKLVLRNTSTLSAPVIHSRLRRLQSGSIIAKADLERSVLLLNDIPGVVLKSTLALGETTGTADLIIDVSDDRRFTGSIDFDNNGNRFTGANRLGGSMNVNNPTGHGDLAALRALSSFSGLDMAQVAYQIPVQDGQVGVSYSSTHYALGQDFASLNAHGTAIVASLYSSYPFIRSRELNLTGRMSYGEKKLQDRIDSNFTATDKKTAVWTIGSTGDSLDGYAGGGMNTFALNYSVGQLNIQTPAAFFVDNITAHTQGNYQKFDFNASRLQALDALTSFYVALSGQFASKNLDTSEKFMLGGSSGVRAYPQGEAPGDEGYLLNLEMRRQLPKPDRLPGDIQLIGLIDSGSAMLNKHAWAAGQNHRNLSGAGLGVNWGKRDDFAFKFEYAWKLGNEKATADTDRNGRLWLQGMKYF